MENWNNLLGIIASTLSIITFFLSFFSFTKVNKIYKKLNISIDSSKYEKNTTKQAVSGENGISIVGDRNSIGDK
ncbi:TPA: hypothetical protein U2C31_001312 [Streptococcus suis]|uniref:hypothetical protein n=1 Tax=Streptococcus suis TaxID=1307 RepID=UPI000CF57ECC|nr:hypothetical protein [Streptococcus suis]MCO8231711.1 hypothetical protein [Streptococcus suis]MDW8715041.1 hypothetical protein [Streptococcus suis]MDW8727143.1 hypothetical protein [Streptococcus suis]NQM34865.1 hypothetical protein [Streptococcus suis]HEM3550978.1 hypothetical protein [Streptococcus suis]